MEYYNKPYMSKSDIKRTFKAGMLELVYKQLIRYGVITYNYNHDVDNGHYMGANRHVKITHHNIDWDIELINGDVKRLGPKH